MKFIAALIALMIIASPAQAKHRHHHRHAVGPVVTRCVDFDIMRPCWPQQEAPKSVRHHSREREVFVTPSVLPHPSGCPRVAFCACGQAVDIFGAPIRSLWLAANWFKFPRAEAAPGMVAVRQHHVFRLIRHIEGSEWLVIDHNSGHHMSREHVRSISGWTIVNPRA